MQFISKDGERRGGQLLCPSPNRANGAFFYSLFPKLHNTGFKTADIRSSYRRCVIEKAGLENFEICTEKHLSEQKACNFIKKRLQQRCFPVNIAEFSRTPILKNIYERFQNLFCSEVCLQWWNFMQWQKVFFLYQETITESYSEPCQISSKMNCSVKEVNRSEAAIRGVLQEKVLLEISQNSQENTCTRASFNKVADLQLC